MNWLIEWDCCLQGREMSLQLHDHRQAGRMFGGAEHIIPLSSARCDTSSTSTSYR
jgi:hypothetical protein